MMLEFFYAYQWQFAVIAFVALFVELSVISRKDIAQFFIRERWKIRCTVIGAIGMTLICIAIPFGVMGWIPFSMSILLIIIGASLGHLLEDPATDERSQ